MELKEVKAFWAREWFPRGDYLENCRVTHDKGKVFREGEIRLFVGIFGVDVGALSLTEASLSWCSELSTRLETRTKESNMDAKGIGWKPLLLAKTNYRENVATRQQRYP